MILDLHGLITLKITGDLVQSFGLEWKLITLMYRLFNLWLYGLVVSAPWRDCCEIKYQYIMSDLCQVLGLWRAGNINLDC